uniref:Uncharacterized protein n=1 Tax=Papio anubis TaxID=9555 RepID=A0A8I5R221_PAPAN
EALNTHRLARNHINNGSITRLQKFRAIFQFFTRTAINLFLQLSKLACNHLSSEASCFHWWVVFAVTSNVATTNILDRFYFSCNVDWSKGDHHTGFENTSLHSANRNSTNTTNFVVGGRMQSRASSSVVPLALPSLRVTFHPLNQGMLALGSSMLSPFQPEIGTTSLTISSYLFWL